MMTFAISLLFTAGAAFAVLVIIGMLASNRAAIMSALAGKGAYAGQFSGSTDLPPLMVSRVQLGTVRHGRTQTRRPAAAVTALRAAA